MNKSGENVILALDPSFDHLAMSLFTGNHKVYVDMCSCKLGTNIGFDKVFNACLDLWNQLKERLDIYLKEEQAEIDYVISEHSPPVSQFSAGLFALDTLIFSKLFETYSSIKEIYILHIYLNLILFSQMNYLGIINANLLMFLSMKIIPILNIHYVNNFSIIHQHMDFRLF